MVKSRAPPQESYIGPLVHRRPGRIDAAPSRNRLLVPGVVVILILGSLGGILALAMSSPGGSSIQATINGAVTIPITLEYQHKDSHNVCTAGPPCSGEPPELPHAWDHAAGDDGVFGTSDDCPHCSAFSAPAAVSMLSTAYGRTGQYTVQDRIYDNGKSVAPEITGDNEIQTHGVGMFDGNGGQPDEVQDGVRWAVGMTLGLGKHDSSNPLAPSELEQYIFTMRPVLWIDHGGLPVNQSPQYPPAGNRALQGHAKVIAGYDDNSTVTVDDDKVLIYDPWPEYNRDSILPVNATPGPGGTYDPYWLPLSDVDLDDGEDIFFIPTTSIPEFSSVLVPVVGILLVAVIAYRRRVREKTA